jgi:DHA2 family multidrug resistance protein-like MFS transporter
VVLEYFWWGAVFLIGVPVMLLLLAVGPVLLPEYRDPNAGRLDILSAAMSLVAVLLVIYGLKRIAEHGLDWVPVGSILAGVAVGVLFTRRQRRLADPLIDLRLFQSPAFSASLAAYTLGTFVSFGAYIYVAQYLQLVLGLSPLEAGLWLIPTMASFIVGSMIVPVIARRVRPAYVMGGGLVLATVGFALLTRLDQEPQLTLIVIGTMMYSLGLSPVVILATDLIVGSAPVERAGAASAISETSSELGGALGIAVLGSVGTALYRSLMLDGVPAGIPAPSAEAARSTLGGALAEAGRLPDALGTELLGSAREAFVQSLELTAAICAAIALATGVMVLVLLRSVRARSETVIEAEPAAVSR